MHLYTFFFIYFHISIFRNLTAYILFYKQSYDFKLTRNGFRHLVSLETFDPILLIEKEMIINLGRTFSILLHSE